MTAYKRQQYLEDVLREKGSLRLSEMAVVLGVSEGTIRNDLNALEERGQIKRVHGGAIHLKKNQISTNSFSGRYAQNLTQKRTIAREAAKLVENRDSILLDASSTAYCFACRLINRKELRVITNGLDVAMELTKNPSNNVILIGGVVDHEASSVTGLLSEQIIEDFYVQKAFLSCSGFTIERGMTELHIEEAQLKRKIISSAQEVYALVDASKLGKEDLTPFASIENITKLFTDDGISDEWKEALVRAGIDTVICSPKANNDHE